MRHLTSCMISYCSGVMLVTPPCSSPVATDSCNSNHNTPTFSLGLVFLFVWFLVYYLCIFSGGGGGEGAKGGGGRYEGSGRVGGGG